MPFDGTDQCWMPDIPVQNDFEWRLRIAQFGDGYAQRTLDGINPLNQKWSLTWDNREAPVIQEMVLYLITRQAHSFPFWDQQSGVTHKVFCDAWNITWNLRRKGPVYYGSLSAEFVKANGETI